MIFLNHKSKTVWSHFGFSLLLLFSLVSYSFAGEPRIPINDGEILASITSSNTNDSAKLKSLRKQLKASPDNIVLASKLARAYIEIAREFTDVRYYGYAQAVLKPWWEKQNPPSEVLLLRATLNQQKHEYERALDDLKQLIKRQPKNTQAWLTLSIIQQVRGDYKSARASCSALSRSNSSWLSTLCYSQVLGLTGSAERAYNMQQAIALQLGKARPDLLQWVVGISAETALRLGNNKDAEKLFKQALALPVRDAYLLRVYSDFLLETNRAGEVVTLLNDEEGDTALLLRLAIASRNTDSDSENAKRYQYLIESRFKAASLRASKLHERDEALYLLTFDRDLDKALTLAKENWKTQKEPDDALILLRLAVATQSIEDIKTIRDWIQETQLQDIRIERLLKVDQDA